MYSLGTSHHWIIQKPFYSCIAIAREQAMAIGLMNMNDFMITIDNYWVAYSHYLKFLAFSGYFDLLYSH